MRHRVGDFYEFITEDGVSTGEYFLLTCVDIYSYCLVDINDGNRWHNPIKVGSEVITEDYFELITQGDTFKKVNRNEVLK